MPVYEYECQACGHYLESLQKISEPPLTDCPACGKPELKKLISAFNIKQKDLVRVSYSDLILNKK